MKVKLLSILFAVLLLTIVISGCFEEKPKTSSYDILVDDDGDADYSKIQDAIDNASNGDTIYVKSGTYNERITISKKIKLIGEDKYKTIIDKKITSDSNDKTAIDILANFVTFERFTIDNYDYAVYIYSSYNKIFNNIFRNNSVALFLSSAIGNNITNNILDNNPILLRYGSKYNYITHNDISNSLSGIELMDSNNNIIKNNDLSSSQNGIGLWSSNNNEIIDNIIKNMTAEGIASGSSNYNLISKNSIIDSNQGIVLLKSSNNKIKFNSVLDNEYGLMIHSLSENNTIYQNNFENTIANCLDGSTDLKNNSNVFYNESIKTGNYWDDYNGLDLDDDGLGDTIYIIYDTNPYNPVAANQDKYPSINPLDI